MTARKVLSVRRYKAGYEIREEEIDMAEESGYQPSPGESAMLTMKSAYTPEGDYIGDPKWAYRLCKKRGIKPEKIDQSHNICSVGFCEMDQKWYGWSHRAICGFSIGDVVKEGDCAASSGWTDEWIKDHPEDDESLSVVFEAKTLDDARRMAVAFALSVS